MKHLKLHLIAFVTLCFLLAGSNAFADLTLPDSMTVIGEQAFMNDARLLGTVTIPEGVTTIGKEAFYCCTGIDTLVLPYSVEKIESRAFAGCSGLTGTVVLPYGCEVAEDAFDGCEALTVKIVETTPIECFTYTISNNQVTITGFDDNCGLTDIVVPTEIEGYPVKRIGSRAFKDCQNLTSITISAHLVSIDTQSFYGCSNLSIVYLPEGITEISYQMFMGCSSLTNINIPQSVTAIDIGAFNGCSSLTHIVLPEDIVYIGPQAFSKCSSLRSVIIPESISAIESAAFSSCNSLSSITLPDGVISIGNSAFYDCISLESVTLPEGVTTISGNAFDGCSSLTSIHIPESVTSIGSSAFARCSSLTSITIPEGVTTIENYTFIDCNHLSSISIPQSVTSIGNGAFCDCSSLNSATLSYGVTSIGEQAFSGCINLSHISIPKSITSIGAYAFDSCTNLSNIIIPKGVTFIGEYAFYKCSSLTEITIPEGVTTISDGVFYWCTNLKSITIPEGVMQIGAWCFADCNNLANITIPDSVVYIGEHAFHRCRALSNIKIPHGIKAINESVFADCNSLISVVIPAGVTSIGAYAFDFCNTLTSITIPEGVTSIGNYAFYCSRKMTSIYIPSSVTSIGTNVFDGIFNLTIYGERGSYAEEYALANNIPFIAGEMPEPDYGEMNASAAVTVLSPDGTALVGVNVEVLTTSDKAVVTRGITDAQGRVIFSSLQLRSYIFRCSDELFEFDDKYYTLTETESALTLKAKEPAFDYLATNADSYTAEAGGSTVSIAVSSSGDWRASTQDAWLTLGASEGVPGDVLSVTAAANDGLFRTGTVTLASGEWEISVYIQQAGAMSSRLPDPVITTPAEETVTVPYGDITITWEPVEGAGSYVISMRDLTTDDLILHHERLADQTQAVLNALHFSDDHSYRVAVGAVPPGAASTESCVSWKEIVFVVEEFIDDTPVSFSGTVYELFDPSLVSTFQLIARNGMDPELMAQARESAEEGIDFRPFVDCTVQIYHLAKNEQNEEWWEFLSETKTDKYGDYTFNKGLISGEEYSFVISEDGWDFISGKVEHLTYTAQPGNNQVIDNYGFSVLLDEKIEAFRQIAGFDITGYPSGLFAEYFEYDKRKKSSYMYLTDEKIPSETAALLANYKRNEGVVSNVNFTWAGETVKKSGATYYALNAYKFGADPDKASAKDTVNYVPFNFAAAFNGYVKLKGADNADELKSYMFRVRGDDGVKLKLNLPFYESYAEDEWSNRGLSENEAVIDLTSEAYLNGTVLKVGIAYYNKTDGGEANLTFEYSIDKGKSWHVVPSSWLYHSSKERQISVMSAEAYGGINYAAKLAQSRNQLANYGDQLVTKLLLDLGSMSINGAVSAYNTGTVMFSEVSLSSSEKLARYVTQKIGVNTTKAVYAAVVKRSTNVSSEKDLWAAIAAELKSTYSIEFDTVYDVTTNTIDGIATMQSMMNAMSENASSNASITRLQYDVLDYIESYSIGDLSDLDSSSGNVKAGYSTLFELTGSKRKELENEVVKLDSDVKSVWGFAVKGIELLNVLSDPDAANRNRAALSLMYAETNTTPEFWDVIINHTPIDYVLPLRNKLLDDFGEPITYPTRKDYETKLNSLTDAQLNILFSALQKVDLQSLLYNDLLKLVLDNTYSYYKKAFNGKI